MTYLKFRVIVVCLAAVLALGITLPLMALSPPVLVMPADGAEVSGSAVTFSWNHPQLPDGVGVIHWYILQISSQSDFSSTIVNINGIKTTSTTVNNIPQDGSLYYWRVRVSIIQGTLGQVNSAWSAPRMFLAKLAPPPPPASLISPAQGAQVATIPIAFNWSPSTGAVKYHLQVSTQNSFVSTFFNTEDLNNTIVSVTPFPQNGSTYYWRVKATDALGRGDWSQVRSFVSAPPPPPVPQLSYQVSPADGTHLTTKDIVFKWSPSSGAAKYHLQISANYNFYTTFYNSENLGSTERSVTNFPQDGTTFYWRVRALNTTGQGSDWSDLRSFVSAPPPQPPSPPSYAEPANGATASGSAVALIWNASAGATRYHLQVARQPGFPITNLFFTNDNITATQYAVPGLPNDGTKLYWRVRAFKEEGGWSAWNNDGFQTRHFVNGQSQEPPGVPLLVLPAQGAIISGNSVALSWRVSSGVVKYHVQIGKNSSFTTIFFNSDNINGTSFTWSNFPPGVGRYYWRVRACNAAGVWGDWSETRMFNIN